MMTIEEKVGVVHDYIEMAHEQSRVRAAKTYIAPDATISLNGNSMTRAEYIVNIEESDRFFVPKQTEIEKTVVQDDVVAILAVSTLEQVESAYGIEPTGERIEQYFAVFHRIVDGEIVRLDVLADEAAKFQQLGLLSEDPTVDQLQDQYYQVLNRVLRHDLRNRLNVIRLVADSLADDTVDDATVAGVKIRTVVDELLQTTDKARALEQLAIETSVEPVTFRVDSLVDEILRKYTENTDATCTATYPDEIPVLTTDKKLLWNALNELIENAIKYNDTAEPSVTVDVRNVVESRYECELRIEDNGPPIPDEVLEPIITNRETKLLHGSGIGLWIAKWCLTRIDGDITFERHDSGGTRIRILLPYLK